MAGPQELESITSQQFSSPREILTSLVSCRKENLGIIWRILVLEDPLPKEYGVWSVESLNAEKLAVNVTALGPCDFELRSRRSLGQLTETQLDVNSRYIWTSYLRSQIPLSFLSISQSHCGKTCHPWTVRATENQDEKQTVGPQIPAPTSTLGRQLSQYALG